MRSLSGKSESESGDKGKSALALPDVSGLACTVHAGHGLVRQRAGFVCRQDVLMTGVERH